MDIKPTKIAIREIVNGYKDSAELGVVAYGGKLNVRPAYQREFVYKEKQRNSVLETVIKGFPLNIMYWAVSENGSYELMDGQQRTLSICQYVNNDFSLNNRSFHNLTETEKEQILDYKLDVYICTGTDKEKLDWFQIINIAGEELSNQELRNAIYSGSWVSDAKLYFSKTGCVAYKKANKYLNKKLIRQEYLETAIRWIANKENVGVKNPDPVAAYMSLHQQDETAEPLWLYFQNVIDWVKSTFSTYRKEMASVDWGILYNKYGEATLDPILIEAETKKLMSDPDVNNTTGIYTYLLDHDEKHLSFREFDERDKRIVYEQQSGICPICEKKFAFEDMEGDHIKPWSKGGITHISNLQMLCKPCNLKKSAMDVTPIE